MTPQKDRLLFLLELLNRETDEQHPMTISEIIDRLKQASFACGWKSVRNDIDRLIENGIDVVCNKGRELQRG